MKIVKGSSFATWTKKLQGKGVGFPRSKSSSPRNVSRSHQNVPTPSVLPSLDVAFEERGDSERSVRHGHDHRDDVAEGRNDTLDAGGAPGVVVSGSENETEQSFDDKVTEESDQELTERMSILLQRGPNTVDESLPTAISNVKVDNPVTDMSDKMYEDGHNGSIVESSTSSGAALCSMPSCSCSCSGEGPVCDVASSIDRKTINQSGIPVNIHNHDTLLEKPEVSWGASLAGEADGVNIPKADEHLSVLEASGEDMPVRGNHCGHATQDQKQARASSRSNSFEAESNIDDSNGCEGCFTMGKSSGKPASVTGHPSESSGSSGGDRCEKDLASVADAVTTAGGETRTHPDQATGHKTIATNVDRLPCAGSQANIECEGPDSGSKDIEVTSLRANDLSLLFHVQEANNGKPGRRFPKTPLAAWAGLKRLAKNDKVTGHQDAAHAAGLTAQDKGVKKDALNGLDGPSAKKMTMKNRMRQEKRALGRVKQKRLKKSFVGVGELIPAGGAEGASSQLPATSTSTLSAIGIDRKRTPFSAPLSPRLSPLKTTGAECKGDPKTAKPKREKMADMIWWSNENKSVEIIAVKSDEFAKAWDEEQGQKELKNGDAVGNQPFQAETGKILSSKPKERHNGSSGKGKDKKSKSTDKKRLEKKGRSKTNGSGRALASLSSDVSDNEHCACNDEVIQDGRILCGDHDGKIEEAGFPDIKNDLREMAKELLKKGPGAMVHWLE